MDEAEWRVPVGNQARARMAARNNAEWCDAVCRAHGLPGEFTADAWTNPHRTPPYYPDAVTLSAVASAEYVVDRIDTASPGCSVKDSFACLDLTDAGFRVLFDAQWIYLPQSTTASTRPVELTWAPAAGTNELLSWEAAWGGSDKQLGLFPPTLLADAAVTFLCGWRKDRIIGGCVATTGAGVIGISNLFHLDGDLDAAWTGVLAAVALHLPGQPVVGYEGADALAAAFRQGFTAVGPLRVWLRDA